MSGTRTPTAAYVTVVVARNDHIAAIFAVVLELPHACLGGFLFLPFLLYEELNTNFSRLLLGLSITLVPTKTDKIQP